MLKKSILFMAALLVASAAMAGDGTIKFKTIDNKNDMQFFASTALPDSQNITTDLMLLPEATKWFGKDGEGLNIGFSQYIVMCMATKEDFVNGDPNAHKEGFVTKTSLPERAKITKLSLPGVFVSGHTDSVSNQVCDTIIGQTFVRSSEDTLMTAQYTDDEWNDYLNLTSYQGFIQLNEPTVCKLQKDDPQGTLLHLPFTKPYVYEGKNVEVLQTLDALDPYNPRSQKGVRFRFALTKAQVFDATVYFCYQLNADPAVEPNPDGNAYVLYGSNEAFQEWKSNDGIYGIVSNFLNLTTNTLPAFQFDFYTNDIRGTVTQNDLPAATKTLKLYQVTATGRDLVETVTTDNEGRFEFLNLDYTAKYVIEIESDTLPETELTFGGEDDAIENDIEAEIVLNTPSGVQDVDATKVVTAVKYYNMQGVEASEPFDGVNIVVKTYNDGSKTNEKLVK